MLVPVSRAASALLPGSAGRVVGALANGEAADELARALLEAEQRAADDDTLLTHADLDTARSTDERAQTRAEKRAALATRRLKRFVLRVPTSAGERIVKIEAIRGLGNHLSGLWTSVGRREHHAHARAQALGLAAARTLGFLEWRVGPRLRRSCQVQTVLDADLPSLDALLRAELAAHGDAALEPFARELARQHALPFFHADLKGFHAFAAERAPRADGPDDYRLRWIDLARVSFYMTPRKRLINLYQALRFVVPRRPEAEERFVHAYCAAAGWYADAPERIVTRVRRFLAYKLRTHPNP